jgi:hypothetical protein
MLSPPSASADIIAVPIKISRRDPLISGDISGCFGFGMMRSPNSVGYVADVRVLTCIYRRRDRQN